MREMRAAAERNLDQRVLVNLAKCKFNIPKLPKPWAAKVAAIIRPRIRVEANSEEMTAESG